MRDLFRIKTKKVHLIWSAPSEEIDERQRAVSSGGRLIIKKINPLIEFSNDTWRAQVPEGISNSVDSALGPALFENINYSILIESESGNSVKILNRDPLISKNLHTHNSGKLIYGNINFHSQVGLSDFHVLIDGKPEFDFSVEVFPSKMDYESDYKSMLADVQEILTGLAFESLLSKIVSG